MSLDVPTPDPPGVYREDRDEEFREEVDGSSRRADVQEYLAGPENAWGEGFGEWAAETSLVEDEYRPIEEAGLLEAFDFFWDGEAEVVGYTAPEVPDDWETDPRYSWVDSWSTASAVNEELDALGETVAGVLTDYFLEWETEAHVVETFGSQFNGRDDVLTDFQDAREDE